MVLETGNSKCELLNFSSFAGFSNQHFEMNHSLIKKNEMQSGIQTDLVSERTSQVVILEKAYSTLFDRFDKQIYRFNLSVRWIPGSLREISPENILNVEMLGEAERYTNFEVTYEFQNRKQSAQVQLSVDIEKKIPVANRRIMYGEVLDTENLEYRWVSIPNDRGQLVSEMEKLTGKTVRRTLAIGQPVRFADITTDFLILAGDHVKLIFEEHGVRIEMNAQARQDGAKDELIKIYSEKTRTRYMGKVISPDVVQWRKTL